MRFGARVATRAGWGGSGEAGWSGETVGAGEERGGVGGDRRRKGGAVGGDDAVHASDEGRPRYGHAAEPARPPGADAAHGGRDGERVEPFKRGKLGRQRQADVPAVGRNDRGGRHRHAVRERRNLREKRHLGRRRCGDRQGGREPERGDQERGGSTKARHGRGPRGDGPATGHVSRVAVARTGGRARHYAPNRRPATGGTPAYATVAACAEESPSASRAISRARRRARSRPTYCSAAHQERPWIK